MPASVNVTFLGGLGEIGRNCAVIESGDELLLLDCGIMFPDLDMLGVDLVLPDFDYLRANRDRIVGCVATHGHEDHVGGLSFLLRELSFPVYGSALTLGLARHRIEEAGLLDRTELIPVADGERRRIGRFDVEFVPVSHSVPHGFATVFRTPQGVIAHSGDWKLDTTPVDGRRTDLGRLGAIADTEGIRLLLADSTNADEAGHSASETSVGRVLNGLFREQAGRRLVISCFASHIHRIQQIADAAIAVDRKIATLGLSMMKNVRLAREMGILQIPDSALVDIDDVDGLPPGQVCIISTGSQGEPMSALTLMASQESRWLKIGPDDTVILSSHPIPGNSVTLTDAGVTRGPSVPAGYLYVDGSGIGDVGHGVLRDRRVLAEEGVVVVFLTVDLTNHDIVTGPEIVTRGWVYAPNADTLLDGCADAVRDAVTQLLTAGPDPDIETLQRTIRRTTGQFVNASTKRRPMIVPVVIEV